MITPFILIILSVVLLYLPPVQEFAVNKITKSLKESTGLNIEIGKIRLRPPLKLELNNVNIIEANGDTMIMADKLITSAELIPLINSRIVVPTLEGENVLYSMTDSTGNMHTKNYLEKVLIEKAFVDLKNEVIDVYKLKVSNADIIFTNTDTISKEEEDKEPSKWHITASSLKLDTAKVYVYLKKQNILLDTKIDHIGINNATADIQRNLYLGDKAILLGGKGKFAMKEKLIKENGFFDYRFMTFEDMNLDLENFRNHMMEVNANVLHFSVKESSGINIQDFSVDYAMNEKSIKAKNFRLITPNTDIESPALLMDWDFLKNKASSNISAKIKGVIDIQDVEKISAINILKDSTIYKKMIDEYDIDPRLNINIDINGTPNKLNINKMDIGIEEAISIKSNAIINNIFVDKTRSGSIKAHINTEPYINNLVQVLSKDLASNIYVDSGLNLDVDGSIKNNNISAKAYLLDNNKSSIAINSAFNFKTLDYKGNIDIKEIELNKYLPNLKLSYLDANIDFIGKDFDPRKKGAKWNIKGIFNKIINNDTEFSNITIESQLNKGLFELSLGSINDGLNLALQADGTINNNQLNTSIRLDIDSLSSEALGIKEKFSSKLALSGDYITDFEKEHRFNLELRNVKLNILDTELRPQMLDIRGEILPKHIKIRSNTNGWKINLDVENSLDSLLKKTNNLQVFAKKIVKDIQSDKMDSNFNDLVKELPNLKLDIIAEGDHPIKDLFIKNYIIWENLNLKAKTSKNSGIDIEGYASAIRYENNRIDSIFLNIKSPIINNDTINQRLDANIFILKQKYREQDGYMFATTLNTNLRNANLSAMLRNDDGVPQYSTSIDLDWNSPSYKAKFNPIRPVVIAGERYRINADNSLEINKKNYMLSSNLILDGANNSKVKIIGKSIDDIQELDLNISNFMLSQLKNLGLNNIDANVFGDIKYVREGDISNQPTITGDISLSNLLVEGKKLGHISTALFYEPRNNNSHYVTAELSHEGNRIVSINGIYTPKSSNNALNMEANLIKLPLSIINPFIENTGVELKGQLDASISARGTLNNPLLDGKINFDSSNVNMTNYSMNLDLSNDDIVIDNSNILFKSFPIYSKYDKENPFIIKGNVNISDINNIISNLRLTSNNTTLIDNSQPTYTQSLYGKLVLSSDILMRGAINSLNVRGDIDVVNGTNIKYVLQKNKLSNRNNFDGLVDFVDLSDTIFVAPKIVDKKQVNGMDVAINLNIAPAVRMGVDLNSNHSDYIRVQGGSNLSFRMPKFGDMSLIGSYILQDEGELKYSLPIIGTIASTLNKNSSIKWNGSIDNPYIDFSASSKIKSTVSDSKGKNATVNFVVILSAKDYLDKLDIAFDLIATDNLDVQNQLSRMSKEERGKQAISLLTTGIFIGENSNPTGGVDLANTLNSLLESQINKATGTLFQGTDISIGMDHHNASEGLASYTDYTYSLSKRFLNDRIRILFGGKVQSGNVPTNTEQTLIDNASIEYRIDKAGSQYVSAFHKRITDDILEGEYTETGVSYIIRKKFSNFNELLPFIKRKNKKDTIDSLVFKPFVMESINFKKKDLQNESK